MNKDRIVFLLIWLVWGLSAFLPDSPVNLRYANAIGTSTSLVLLVSFLISKLNWRIVFIALAIILISNSKLITKYNPRGSILEINPQGSMLLVNQQKVIDYIYREANSESFSINAVTIPYNVKTTWSYLFEWYGKRKFGYLPVFAGYPAEGFEGNLEVLSSRSSGPRLHFLIIEPGRGLHQGLMDKYIDEENIFTTIAEEKEFGEITVQKRFRY